MVSSRVNFFEFSICCARTVAPIILLGELYLNFCIMAPVVFGVSPAYFAYLLILAFIVMNIIGNLLLFAVTDTSIQADTCVKPELNVKLCSICNRNVPPRCVHCEHCNECIPRRRAHCHLLGTCVGFFNHRYFFVSTVHCLFYSANAVAISAIFYNRVLRNCNAVPAPSIGHRPIYEDDYDDCSLLFYFFASAFANAFALIFAIISLTVETQIVMTGKMKRETDARLNYDRGLKRNLICMLGERWCSAFLFPAIKSALPDVHAVLYPVGERPLPSAVRY